ncbi:DUF805 domain-containing protein [Cupriavidus plantarum]|uniref:DUF805 domain-containing protein n=1 Tax=Cupriavidus plantarum TaxID=942865 RepID=UPI00339D3EA5
MSIAHINFDGRIGRRSFIVAAIAIHLGFAAIAVLAWASTLGCTSSRCGWDDDAGPRVLFGLAMAAGLYLFAALASAAYRRMCDIPLPRWAILTGLALAFAVPAAILLYSMFAGPKHIDLPFGDRTAVLFALCRVCYLVVMLIGGFVAGSKSSPPSAALPLNRR